ncbi:glucose 1,6-bisphosphate synthase-like [Onthophagus taurus]|uniref:glucose 1,6-bisphosphate synthase-like n=1 Tax=Onthophagus taurus TaxID=166361 RepID=UPI0039BE718D
MGDEFKTYDKNIDPKIKEYLQWEKNEEYLELVKSLVHKKELITLRKMLVNRAELLGGAVKGEMVAGFNAINELVVIQIGQGFIKYLETVEEKRQRDAEEQEEVEIVEEEVPEVVWEENDEGDVEEEEMEMVIDEKNYLKKYGIVIGYDARVNSKRFAEIIATIFLSQNYAVKLFSKEVITPFVSYAITTLGCVGGVMVSGGACPKTYNGIKLFTSNGCQVIPSADLKIENHISENLEPMEHCWESDILQLAPMLTDPYTDVLDAYLQLVCTTVIEEYLAIASKSPIQFVYTALHGVAYDVFKQVVSVLSLKIVPVPKQIAPNPKFPSVRSPNPEDAKALNAAKSLAVSKKIKYVIGTDPDGCRMIFSQLGKDNVTWRTFDGNELGALFGWWVLDQYKKKHPTEGEDEVIDLSNVYMIGSSVSSKILRTMARTEKFNFVETLPGFRWIANKAYDLKQEGKEVILGFEDTYGYMFTDQLYDKDGIIASVQVMTMVAVLNAQKQTLEDKLNEIYAQYGFHINYGSYFNAVSYDDIAQIFEEIRHYHGDEPEKPQEKCHCIPEAYKDPLKKEEGCCCNPFPPPDKKIYPRTIGKGKFDITHVRDITIGFDNNEPNRKSVLPRQPNMQMITFEFSNGIEITIRTNPKEAKLRFCAEIITKEEDLGLLNGTKLVKEVMHRIINDFLKPTKNCLSLPRS